MKKKLELISESFAPAQQRLATSEFERALAKIERDTIGANWNRRQLDMLNILGAWEVVDPEHISEDRPTVTIFEETFEDELGLTKPAIQGDVNGLMSSDMVEKVLKKDSKKSKIVVLTDDGFAKWSAYSNERVALIVALNSQIMSTGATPKSWRAKVSKWMTYLSSVSSKAAAIGLISLTLSFGGGGAKANPYTAGDLSVLKEDSGFLVDAPIWGTTTSEQTTHVIMAASREELFDRLLPRSHALEVTTVFASGVRTEQADLVVEALILSNNRYADTLQVNALPYFTDLEEPEAVYQFNWGQKVLSTYDAEAFDIIEIADREAVFDKLLPRGHISMQLDNVSF